MRWRNPIPMERSKARARLGSVTLDVFQSVAAPHMSNRAFSPKSTTCAFGRKLKPHVPDLFTLHSSKWCFVMILCPKSIVILFNGLIFLLEN